MDTKPWCNALDAEMLKLRELTWHPRGEHVRPGIAAYRELTVLLARAPTSAARKAIHRSGAFDALEKLEKAGEAVLREIGEGANPKHAPSYGAMTRCAEAAELSIFGATF